MAMPSPALDDGRARPADGAAGSIGGRRPEEALAGSVGGRRPGEALAGSVGAARPEAGARRAAEGAPQVGVGRGGRGTLFSAHPTPEVLSLGFRPAALAWSSAARLAIADGERGTLVLHAPLSEGMTRLEDLAPLGIGGLAWSPGGEALAVLDHGGAVHLLAASGEVRWRRGLGTEPTVARWADDGSHVDVGTAGGSIWRLRTVDGSARILVEGRRPIVGLAAAGERLVWLERDGSVWFLGDGARRNVQLGGPVRGGLAAEPGGARLVALLERGGPSVIDPGRSGRPRRVSVRWPRELRPDVLCWSEHGALAVGDERGQCWRLDLASGQLDSLGTPHDGRLRAILPFGRAIVSGGEDGRMAIRWPGGQTEWLDQRLGTWVEHLATDPRHHWLAASGEPTEVLVWCLDPHVPQAWWWARTIGHHGQLYAADRASLESARAHIDRLTDETELVDAIRRLDDAFEETQRGLRELTAQARHERGHPLLEERRRSLALLKLALARARLALNGLRAERLELADAMRREVRVRLHLAGAASADLVDHDLADLVASTRGVAQRMAAEAESWLEGGARAVDELARRIDDDWQSLGSLGRFVERGLERSLRPDAPGRPRVQADATPWRRSTEPAPPSHADLARLRDLLGGPLVHVVVTGDLDHSLHVHDSVVLGGQVS